MGLKLLEIPHSCNTGILLHQLTITPYLYTLCCMNICSIKKKLGGFLSVAWTCRMKPKMATSCYNCDMNQEKRKTYLLIITSYIPTGEDWSSNCQLFNSVLTKDKSKLKIVTKMQISNQKLLFEIGSYQWIEVTGSNPDLRYKFI